LNKTVPTKAQFLSAKDSVVFVLNKENGTLKGTIRDINNEYDLLSVEFDSTQQYTQELQDLYAKAQDNLEDKTVQANEYEMQIDLLESQLCMTTNLSRCAYQTVQLQDRALEALFERMSDRRFYRILYKEGVTQKKDSKLMEVLDENISLIEKQYEKLD
jgi:hypothetical protein